MKNVGALILAAIGFAISIIALFVFQQNKSTGRLLLAVGGILLFIFYLIIFIQVIKSEKIPRKRKTFWIVAIICVPVIANLIYVFIHDALTTPQKPKEEF
jgi:NADH:ubiquinone oxidoreductase subunit 6 (subunit J)